MKFNPFYGRINRATCITGLLLIFFLGVSFIASPAYEQILHIISGPYLYLLAGISLLIKNIYIDLFFANLITQIILWSPLLFFLLSLFAKRLHDLGGPGWMAIAVCLTAYIAFNMFPGLIGMIITGTLVVPLLFVQGKEEVNTYGTMPLPIINIFSIFGFYRERVVAEDEAVPETEEDAHDPKHVIRRILVLTDYNGDLSVYTNTLLKKAASTTMQKLLHTLPDDKQHTLKEALDTNPDNQEMHQLLLAYFTPDQYQEVFSEEIQKRISAYVSSVYPKMTPAERKELDEYLATL